MSRRVAAALRRGRRMAERLMVDRVEVFRVTAVGPDPLTGQDVKERQLVYAGTAKIQTYEAHESAAEMSGHSATIQRYSLHLPVGSYYPNVGDHVVVTATKFDPHLNGNEYRITAPYFKSMATAYRMHIEEIAS